MYSEAITVQILILAILSIAGVYGAKRNIITPSVMEGITQVIFNITLPLLIFTTISDLTITPEILRNSLFVILFSYISIFLLFFVGKLSTKILKLDHSQGIVHTLHTVFGNIVFLGFPLLNELFPGGEGILYAAIYQLCSNSVMWTYAIYILDKNKEGGVWKNLKNLLNPNTISFLAGLVMMFLHIKLPYIFQQSLGGLGKTTLFLSMLYVGAMLSQISIKRIWERKYIFLLSFNKLLLAPLVLLLVFNGAISMFGLPVNFVAKAVVVMQAAMPCMTILVVLVKKYGADDAQATENVFVTTLFSFITLPFVYYFLQFFS